MSWKQEEVPPAAPTVRFVDTVMGESFWFEVDGLMFQTEIHDYATEDGAIVMERDEALAFFRFLADELGYEIEG